MYSLVFYRLIYRFDYLFIIDEDYILFLRWFVTVRYCIVKIEPLLLFIVNIQFFIR